MISAAILSTLLGQYVLTAPSREELIGALNGLQSAVIAAHNGTRTVTNNAAKTRACIKFAGNGAAPPGSVTIRAMNVILSARIQFEIGFGIPAGIPTIDPNDGHTLTLAERWALTGERYAAIEVQAVPSSTITFSPHLMNANVDFLYQEIDRRTTPIDATCEVAAIRMDDAGIAGLTRCACTATPATCTWNRPNSDGSTTPVNPAPTGFTLGPNTWSGAGCKPKPCFTRFDGVGVDRSWPAECSK